MSAKKKGGLAALITAHREGQGEGETSKEAARPSRTRNPRAPKASSPDQPKTVIGGTATPLAKKTRKSENQKLQNLSYIEPQNLETQVLKPFGTTLPEDLVRRVKVHAAAHDRKVQEIVADALEAWLKR